MLGVWVGEAYNGSSIPGAVWTFHYSQYAYRGDTLIVGNFWDSTLQYLNTFDYEFMTARRCRVTLVWEAPADWGGCTYSVDSADVVISRNDTTGWYARGTVQESSMTLCFPRWECSFGCAWVFSPCENVLVLRRRTATP